MKAGEQVIGGDAAAGTGIEPTAAAPSAAAAADADAAAPSTTSTARAAAATGGAAAATVESPGTLSSGVAEARGSISSGQEAAAAGEADKYARLVTEHALEMISIHDLTEQGCYLYVSTACSSLLGYSPADMLGKPAKHFFHPDDLEENKQLHDELLDDMSMRRPQVRRPGDSIRLRRADGTYVWVVVSTTLTSEGFVCVTRDDSSRISLLQALREDLQQYELLATHCADIISLHAPTSTFEFLYASPSVHVILGYAAEEMAGTSIYDLVHPDDLIAWRTVTEAVNGGQIGKGILSSAASVLPPGTEQMSGGTEGGTGTAEERGGVPAPSLPPLAPDEAAAPRSDARSPLAPGASSEELLVTPATAPTTMDYRMRRKDGSWVWVETVLKYTGKRGCAATSPPHIAHTTTERSRPRCACIARCARPCACLEQCRSAYP